MTKTSADNLMKSFINGDEESFVALYNRFKKPIFLYLLSLLRSEAQAEEITHDTFLKIFLKKDQYNAEYAFSTWAWAIARNAAMDKLRKKDPLALTAQSQSDELEHQYDQQEDIEIILTDKSNREALHKAIEALPTMQREIISLRLFSDLELKEIAQVTKKKLSSIKSSLYRAQQSLEIKLKEGQEKRENKNEEELI